MGEVHSCDTGESDVTDIGEGSSTLEGGGKGRKREGKGREGKGKERKGKGRLVGGERGEGRGEGRGERGEGRGERGGEKRKEGGYTSGTIGIFLSKKETTVWVERNNLFERRKEGKGEGDGEEKEELNFGGKE